MYRLIISAPFGNWIQPPGTTPTLGTFTLERRPGRLLQVLRTVRYKTGIQAWVNKIGLRNPGILSTAKMNLDGKLVSIHGFNMGEWDELFSHSVRLLGKSAGIELNLSCPNVTDTAFSYPELFRAAENIHPRIIVKVPPVGYRPMVKAALERGITYFHCCNTLPTPAGGLSGKPLKRLSLECIAEVKTLCPEALVIGGGGITTTQDIIDYALAGASCFSIGSGLFNPWRALFGVKKLAKFANGYFYSVQQRAWLRDHFPQSNW